MSIRAVVFAVWRAAWLYVACWTAMALLDHVVDAATIVKLKGKSYRVHRSNDKSPAK